MRFLACFLLLFVIPAISFAQTNDSALINKHVRAIEAGGSNGTAIHLQSSGNVVKQVLFLPLYLYQRLISEQISAVCEFEPSCSNYSLQAITQLGFIKGLFLTADRLTRCNGNAQEESRFYLIDHKRGKVIDEPSLYKFKN